MFDQGTNSAETPRTGASAPSLNSMGTETRHAGQPVVRRALSAGLDAGPSNEDAALQAYQQKVADKRQREADRVAADDGELFERIVDALEQRVLDELERRGRRHSPGVF